MIKTIINTVKTVSKTISEKDLVIDGDALLYDNAEAYAIRVESKMVRCANDLNYVQSKLNKLGSRPRWRRPVKRITWNLKHKIGKIFTENTNLRVAELEFYDNLQKENITFCKLIQNAVNNRHSTLIGRLNVGKVFKRNSAVS